MNQQPYRAVADQIPHKNPTDWPKPMGAGLLVELEFEDYDTKIEIPGSELHNLNVGTVRATSPELETDVQEAFLPDGDGSFGKRLLLPEPSLSYVDDEVYEMVGLKEPKPDENQFGDLAFIDLRRIIAEVPEEDEAEGNPPFQPLGERVFLEFEHDSRSGDVIDADSGEKYAPDEDLSEDTNLVVPEAAEAAHSQVASVTKTGPKAEHTYPGQRVIAPAVTDSVTYKGEEYFFVQSPSDLIAVID